MSDHITSLESEYTNASSLAGYPSSTSLSSVSTPLSSADTEIEQEITSTLARGILDNTQPSDQDTNPSETEEPHDTFTKFPKLPLELLRMVWDASLSEPTVVAISCAWDLSQTSMSGWTYSQITRQSSKARQANQEARIEAKIFEQLLITYPAGVHQPKIFTNPFIDNVLFLDQNSMGILAWNDSVPPPKMPVVALHHEWRDFIMPDLETLEENLSVLKSFGTVELVFVVGDERMCWDPVVHLREPSMAPENILEPAQIARVRELLRIDLTQRVTWDDLETHDTVRIEEAREISDDALGWTVAKITYREVYVTEAAI
ncbi:hypothetical protein IFR05_005397 [Cadophora sp. M221]|nr:hypothetical protein IFR05_005397 [Cadophora sp. M221]